VRRYLATLVVLAVGCSQGPTGEMRRAYEKGDFKETVAIGRHALRGDDASPSVHYYYGVALVALGRDVEGFAEVDSAVAGDADLKKKASAALLELSQKDRISASDRARRLRKAHELDETVDLGRERFAVASTYFEDRDFEHAAAMYAEAIETFPDASECEKAYSRLTECWSALGDEEKARAAMETLIERYPRGASARGAAVDLNDILYQEAQGHFDAGEYDEAITVATDLVGRADNRSLQQKGRFLLGQAYEAKGERAAAYEAYREVIRNDRGDSGQIVERARSRILVLQEAGLQ
jgi:tetratricopeptide (TPR) repeat protein